MDRNYCNLLLDYYGQLLTEHQLNILSAYYVDDLSMNEIAENYEISKAAVSDLINRTMKQLAFYEEKLNLIKQGKLLDELVEDMALNEDAKINDYAERLKKIVRN